MIKTGIALIGIMGFSIMLVSCTPKNEYNFKRDFEYLYDVIEKCFAIMLQHLNSNPDRGLDRIEDFVQSQQDEIEAVGKRLDSVVLTEKESQELVRFAQRYTELCNKYCDYIDRRLNPEQRDRFVTAVAENIANRFISQLKMPKNSTEFFKKVIR